MKHIQEAVRAYLQAASGIHTVCAPARHSGEYPLLAVDIREEGTVLLSGGTQAEQHYALTVTAAPDRMRQEEPALLGGLTTLLLRGVPMKQGTEPRVLHPLDIRTEGDELRFAVQLCVPVPPAEGGQEPAPAMERLHFNESEEEPYGIA